MKRPGYMLDHAKEKIRRFPMRTKMFLGYVVPIILVNAAVFGAGSYFLESVYARRGSPWSRRRTMFRAT